MLAVCWRGTAEEVVLLLGVEATAVRGELETGEADGVGVGR